MSIGTKRGRILAIAIALIAASAIAMGATLAYLWTKAPPMENTLEPVAVSCRVNETFDGVVKSNVSVTNTGDVKAYVRASIVATWVDANGNIYGGETPEEGVSYTVTYGSSDWVKGTDGYFYYLSPVNAGADTASLLDTLSPVTEKIPEGYTLGVDLPDLLLDFEQARPSGDAAGFQRGGDGEADRLVRPGLVGDHQIGRQRVEFPVGALHGGVKRLQVDGDVGDR